MKMGMINELFLMYSQSDQKLLKVLCVFYVHCCLLANWTHTRAHVDHIDIQTQHRLFNHDSHPMVVGKKHTN